MIMICTCTHAHINLKRSRTHTHTHTHTHTLTSFTGHCGVHAIDLPRDVINLWNVSKNVSNLMN